MAEAISRRQNEGRGHWICRRREEHAGAGFVHRPERPGPRHAVRPLARLVGSGRRGRLPDLGRHLLRGDGSGQAASGPSPPPGLRRPGLRRDGLVATTGTDTHLARWPRPTRAGSPSVPRCGRTRIPPSRLPVAPPWPTARPAKTGTARLTVTVAPAPERPL